LQDELERLDSEGRVVITDHGCFVLVNVYGPAITSEESAEERYAFKLRFYEVGWKLSFHMLLG
jgi:AP endonuclease-2